MDALTRNEPIPVARGEAGQPGPGLLGRVPRRTLVGGVIGLAALAAIVAAPLFWAGQPEYRVLFSNLSDKDGGAVIASLSQMSVPYRFAPGGAAILVPEERVHDTRLRLASQGLPRGGIVGFELLEGQKFGVTQFQERLNFQRGLEGELARSIQSLAVVQSARVHLALPAQNGFLREQSKPSASVVVGVHPGRSLDRTQIAGIVHLVASSVPNLAPPQVSVIDHTGTLLSSSDAPRPGGLDSAQLDHVRRIEAVLSQRVLDILEPIVGAGNVRAQVTADVDFTQSESTAEQYRPNQGNEPAAVRSMQVLESGSRDAANAQGVPGALSNQPAAPASAPINGKAQPMQGAAAQSTEVSAGRREQVTNYEVDKTVRVVRNAAGTIRRLSGAVVVNHRRGIDDSGKPASTPLSDAELEKVNALVREAMGFNRERGDSLNVVNVPFTEVETPPEMSLPIWQQPETVALARDVGKYFSLVLLALIVVFALVRPALKAMARAPSPRISARVDDPLQIPPPVDVPQGASRVSRDEVVRLARQNPAAVAGVVRSWVGVESGRA